MTTARGVPRQRKLKVAVACDFCRRRKLGCDNAKPKCRACVQHCMDCIYPERQSRERPSNLRIAQLEEQNATLRDAVSSTNASGEYAADGVRMNSVSEQHTSRLSSSASRKASGVTYERETHPKLYGSQYNTTAIVSGDRRSHLFGETARQRQLEVLNQRNGALQWHGVDPELGAQLLAAFWNRQHASGTIVYRTAFMRDMACGGPYFTTLLWKAMLFVATKDGPSFSGQCPADKCGNGMGFRAQVEAELYSCDRQLILKSKVTTLQALLLMSDALYAWCDEKSVAWQYLGLAINMIYDLGLHTSSSEFYRKGTAEDGEIGRRIFWAAYVRDKQQSIYQGRHPRLRHGDSNVPLLFLDEYDELEQFDTLTYSAKPLQLGSPTRSVSCSEQLCKLSIIAESILASIHSEKSVTTEATILLGISKSLQAELDGWKMSLPAYLDLQCGKSKNFDILPHTLSLMSVFHTLTILVHRPFLFDGHLQKFVGPSATTAFGFCSQAASEIDVVLRLYGQHFCFSTCPYFLSYATYVSGTIHVRIAAQSRSGSNAHLALQNCLAILEEQQDQCHAPRQTLKILCGLVQRLNVDLEQIFKVKKSRTEAVDADSRPPSPVSALNSALIDHASLAPVEMQLEHYLSNSDFDIDAVIQSFNLDTATCAGPASTASWEGISGNEQATSRVETATSGLMPEVGHYEHDFGQFQFTDNGGVFDPIFGIDTLWSEPPCFLPGSET